MALNYNFDTRNVFISSENGIKHVSHLYIIIWYIYGTQGKTETAAILDFDLKWKKGSMIIFLIFVKIFDIDVPGTKISKIRHGQFPFNYNRFSWTV